MLALALELSGFDGIQSVPIPNQPAQVLLAGLVIMADWMSSNEKAFPYFEAGCALSDDEQRRRADLAWEYFSLQAPAPRDDEWKYSDLYSQRFCLDANEMQLKVAECLCTQAVPSLMVIEAPMGQGKTEAALVAVEIMQNRTQRNGLFFALPTQATTNAAFPRILSWMERLMPFDRYAVRLAHGKAQFNDEYVNLPSASGISEDAPDDGAIVNSWFEGGKKALLADYVVGTIDQLLLMALKQKHVMLRHLGLADKVVVIDECHAFDSYMGQYLYMALRWLGAYKTPVVIMSATLPPQKRREMIAAYMGKSTASNLPLSDANAYGCGLLTIAKQR